MSADLRLIILTVLRVAEQRDEHLSLCTEAVRAAAVNERVGAGVRLVRAAAEAPLGVPAHESPFAVRQSARRVPVVVRPIIVLSPKVHDHVGCEVLDIDALFKRLVILLP